MDQRAKGGSTPPRSSASGEPQQDRGGEKKSREDVESGEAAKDKEEKRGAGRTGPGDKGAVLELLIEGRCGHTGQRPLLFPGTTSDCPEGNVRLRIGLQAKRTKKPPKMLESYVCKPTIRTYQRQGRAEVLRGGREGVVGQQGTSSPTQGVTAREHSSALDPVQQQTKQTASTAPSPPSSSSRSVQLPPSSSSTALAVSALAPASPPTGTENEVPIKLPGKTEGNSNAPPEKATRDKLTGVGTHPVSAGHKSCSLKTDQTTPPTPSTQSPQTSSMVELRNEDETQSSQTGKKKGVSNGKAPPDSCGPAKTSKVKIGNISRSSSSTPQDLDSPATAPVSSSFHNELCQFQKSRADAVSSPCSDPKPQHPILHLFPSSTETQDPPLPDKKRDKERKAKKGNKKEKKYKRERGEAGRVKSEYSKEEGKKKKRQKEKDRKSRHGSGTEAQGTSPGVYPGAENSDRGKTEKKRDMLSPDSHKAKDKRADHCEADDVGKPDKVCKSANPGERDKVDETSQKPVTEAESAAADDNTKSKEQDISLRLQPVTPSHRSSPPPSLSPLAACSVTSPSTLPQEQDSRPLKKRKARRPSWTKLVHRVQRAENPEAPSDSRHNSFLSLPEKIKTGLSTKSPEQYADPAHLTASSSSLPPCSPRRLSIRSSSPVSQFHSDPSPLSPRYPMTPGRKRGRPKSHSELTPRSSPKAVPEEAPHLGCDGPQNSPSLETSPSLQSGSETHSIPRKRGRPPKRPLPEDPCGDRLRHSEGKGRYKGFSAERGIRQLKIRKLLSEIKKKRKRLYTGMRSEYGRRKVTRREADCEGSAACRSTETTAHTLSALSPLCNKWGPQINVSKRGTIYMGKRRGRKPKAQTTNLNSSSQKCSQPSSLFTTLSDTSLFASHHLQPPATHPFPSPSLTHSSGAQSPYSEGSFTEPVSSLVFPHPFSLPSPSSSCTSPHPPPSSSLSPFVKKSCPCQGRLHFPFHQSSCKLSSLAGSLHHTPGSPAHLKEAIPSPRSESHSEETLPSDSGIGTDNNSVSERGGEMRGGRSMFRIGQGTGLILGGQRFPSSLTKRPSPITSHLTSVHRHVHPSTPPAAAERHRERHRHRRRDYDCVSLCTCMCSCPCPGHSKCTHVDSYHCLGQNAMKKQKSKHKKKHQQLHMHDPEFLAELEDLISQLSEVHIGRRGWVRSGLGQGVEGGGKADGGRRHHSSSSHPMRSNIFRINLNGFYSPHPSAYSTNPSYNPQPYYPCQPLQCGRKPDRRQCGCPSKFQDTIDDMGFYRGYPPSVPLYSHLHSSYPLPPPHQYVSHQPHHPHFLLNPARFHRRMSRLMRGGGAGAEAEEDPGGGGVQRPASGFTSPLGCDCGRGEHKHKRKHRHRRCDRNAGEEDDVDEDDVPGAGGTAGSKPQTGFVTGPAEEGRKGSRGRGSTESIESTWQCKNVRDTFSSAAAGTSSLPRLSAERLKQTCLTSLGLGSSHLSSFGGSWGGLGQPWMKTGGAGRPGFSLFHPSWSTLASEKQAGRLGGSDREEEDDNEFQQLYSTPQSPTHINLFTSAAMETGRKGLKIGIDGPGMGERESWRREDLAWRERRGTGSQGDSRSRGQQRGVPAADGAEVRKRGPGRPRKHPLPVAPASPAHPSVVTLLAPEGIRDNHARDRREAREKLGENSGAEKCDSELAVGAKRRRGRKRKHSESPCRQSLSEDKPDSDDPTECYDPLEPDQAPASAPTSTVQWESRADSYPRKKFLSAGLYSDDYKTTDPAFEADPTSRESLECTPGERDLRLLPAPLHVGKYLRLKRIDFTLPYDVLWLWRHNQLHRQPAVPLKRKRHYCRLKRKTRASRQQLTGLDDISSLFPHLEMEPMTSTERSFVVNHSVFLVRNRELVRDKQIQLRMERERQRHGAERDATYLPCDGGSSGDSSNIQSDEPVGLEEMVTNREPHKKMPDTSSSVTACPTLTKAQNGREEDKAREGEISGREMRRKRLNNILLTLQHS